MQNDLPIEERILILESRVNELERSRQDADILDQALLRRIDDFISDLRRIERVQMVSFDRLEAGQKEAEARLTSLETGQKAIIETLNEHTRAITGLAQGQAQIIELLTGGKSPRND